MKPDTVSGTLLILSSLIIVVVMAFHPTGHGLMNRETFAQTVHLGQVVHALAIAATPLMFLGLLGVSRTSQPSELAIAAMVACGFGSVAVISAALASGFVFPAVITRMVVEEEGTVPRAFLIYTSIWNRAFAGVHVVAFSVGIILLAIAIFGKRDRFRSGSGLGLVGIVVGVAVLVVFLSGKVHLDVHGARILWFLQSAWLLWLGVAMLIRRRLQI